MKGAYLYDVRNGWGELPGGVPQKADKRNEAAGIMYMTGGRGKNFENFADVI